MVITDPRLSRALRHLRIWIKKVYKKLRSKTEAFLFVYGLDYRPKNPVI